MKKLCNFLLLLILFVSCAHPKKTSIANASGYSGYAKVLEDCVLYKNSNLSDDITNVFFIVPESYFVYILEKSSGDVFKVQYGKFVGYIKASSVILCTFVPIVKILEGITCDVKVSSGTQIWTSPSDEGTVLTTISAGTKNISYVASCNGKVPSGGRSGLWYYISYTSEFNSTNVYEGYVYSENITNLSSIFLNTESNPEVLNENSVNEKLIYISPSIKTILIVLIVAPIIVLILIILYKLTKKLSNNTNNAKFEENYSSDNNSLADTQNNGKLKNQLNKFRSLSFFKRRTESDSGVQNYPNFPHYDSEDDML